MDAHDRMFGEIAVRLELLTREQLAACRQVQSEGGPARNLGQLALALGLMSEAEVELVSSQQRRVLARRREARESSRREAGAQLASDAPMPPMASMSSAPPANARPARAKLAGGEGDREPTVPRVPHEPRSILGMGLAVPDMPPIYNPGSVPVEIAPTPRGDSSSARPVVTFSTPAPGATAPAPPDPRATYDDRPHARSEARAAAPPEAAATPASAPPPPSFDHPMRRTPQPSAAPTPASAPPPGFERMRRTPPPVPPEARAQASTASGPTASERPGKRTELPPSRAKRLAQPPASNTNASATSRASLSRAAGGTLLGGSGQLEQAARLDAVRSLAPPAGSLRPADRGWRNPSRPPPPQAARSSGSLDPGRAEPAPPVALAAGGGHAVQPLLAPESQPAPARYLDQLLRIAADSGASDLHAHSGTPVLARIDGRLYPLTGDTPLQPQAAEAVIAEVMSDEQWETLQSHGEVRFGYELPGLGCFRALAYRQARGLDIVFRVLGPTTSLAALDLPAALLEPILAARSGLFLVSGGPGAGKTTTLAALTHALANEHGWYVVTAEAPIEIAHPAGLGLIEQREIPFHAHGFAECIDQAVQQGADAIVISELSSAASLAAALRAAQSGSAVLAAVSADSPWRAIAQLLSPLQGNERCSIRGQLASVLRGVSGQQLLVRSAGRGRVPAVEIVPVDGELAQLIEADRLDELECVIRAASRTASHALESSLRQLVETGVVDRETAERAARDPAALAPGRGAA